MNAEQAQRFQQLLDEACTHHIEYDGGTIIDRSFVRGSNGQCPLTCLFGQIGILNMERECQSLLETDKFSFRDVWAFMDGFDNRDNVQQVNNCVAAWLVGKALRAKYIQEK